MTEQRVWHHASVRELPGVIVMAGRLFLAHWPAFLALAFLGVAVKNAAIWAAIEVSGWSTIVAQVLLILAPLGFLLPVIAMLHLCRTSIALPPAGEGKRPTRLLDISVAVLVPFLAVYVANGFLDEDRVEFLNGASFAEWDEYAADHLGLAEVGSEALDARVGYYPFLTVVGIVAVAWLLRWALGRFEKRRSFLALAAAGALVEVYWTGIAARYASDASNRAVSWVEDRRAVHAVSTSFDQAVSNLGPWAQPVDTATTWLWGLLGSVDAVVIVPLAWITVAAVVLGHTLMPAPVERHPVLDRLSAVPDPVRRGLASLTGDLRARWSAFWSGLRLIGAAGLVPMLVFCLTFLLALRIPWLFSQAMRVIIGPTSSATWHAWRPIESGLGMALQMALLAPLLAAAIAWLVRPSARPAPRTATSRS